MTDEASSAGRLDPRILAEVSSFTLKARIVADSVLHGMHRSRHHGASVEFAEHKEYAPGDNVRHLDWRAFARFDRDYIKRFEDESHLRALALIDTSASMGYRGAPDSGRPSKLEYSTIAAAALAYVLAKQGDAFGLATFAGQLEVRVPPRARRGHLQEVMSHLEGLKCAGPTSLAPALDALAEGMGRRMMVLIFSDLLDAGQGALEAIAKLGARRHDVVLFHVMDPDELEFPFEDATLFVSMEDAREVQIDAREIRAAYLDEVRRFLQTVESATRSARVEYHLLRTDGDPGVDLGRFMAQRTSMRTKVR